MKYWKERSYWAFASLALTEVMMLVPENVWYEEIILFLYPLEFYCFFKAILYGWLKRSAWANGWFFIMPWPLIWYAYFFPHHYLWLREMVAKYSPQFVLDFVGLLHF